jgi:hypothetical protein
MVEDETVLVEVVVELGAVEVAGLADLAGGPELHAAERIATRISPPPALPSCDLILMRFL